MKYAIGIPHTGNIPGTFLDDLMSLRPVEVDGFHLIRIRAPKIEQAREVMVQRFLANDKLEYLLLLNIHTRFHHLTLSRLARRIDSEIRYALPLGMKPPHIVGAVESSTKEDVTPMLPLHSIIPAYENMTELDTLLFSRYVFQTSSEPWFPNVFNANYSMYWDTSVTVRRFI